MPSDSDRIRLEALAEELAALTGESPAAAVERILRERIEQLRAKAPAPIRGGISAVLEREVWPLVPSEFLGTVPLTKEEEERILGFGLSGA